MDATNLLMLIEMATTARDAAGAKRAQSAIALEAARQQLLTLRGYASDYSQRARATMTQGADVAAQMNLRAFTARLDRAIEQQRVEVGRCEALHAEAERDFLKAQRKLKSLQALQERGAEYARSISRRREQKVVDELAQTMLSSRERELAAAGW